MSKVEKRKLVGGWKVRLPRNKTNVDDNGKEKRTVAVSRSQENSPEFTTKCNHKLDVHLLFYVIQCTSSRVVEC